MLIDITFKNHNPQNHPDLIKFVRRFEEHVANPSNHPRTGVYLGYYLPPWDVVEDLELVDRLRDHTGNLAWSLDEVAQFKKEFGENHRLKSGMRKYICEYGVCDSVEQLLAHPEYEPILNHPLRKFTVFLVELLKKNEPPDGGWRWHKWGPYIGTQKYQCEYLAHEPNIERIFTFHVYEHFIGGKRDDRTACGECMACRNNDACFDPRIDERL